MRDPYQSGRRLLFASGRKLRGARDRIGRRWHERDERRFDARYGTDTSGAMDPEDAQAGAYPYEAINPRALTRLLRQVDTPYDETTFFDVGCGRGRALIIAAHLGYSRVVGVEIEDQHLVIARRNVAAFAACGGDTTAIEVCHGDARQLALPPGPLVLFLYNPFDAQVLSAVVDQVGEELRRQPRPCWVLYVAPRHRDVFDARDDFGLVADRHRRVFASPRRPRFAMYRHLTSA